MPKFNLCVDRVWTPSPFATGWDRTGLLNDRPQRPAGSGDYTTLVRHTGAGQVVLPAFGFTWELLLISGDLNVDGHFMAPRDHCIVEATEKLQVRTDAGCEYLVIAR